MSRFTLSLAVFAVLLVGGGIGAGAQSWESLAPILPSPDPFSLNSYDAIQAVFMLQREPLLLVLADDGTREILSVRSVRSVWVGFNPDAYENHQNRYDIEVNGEMLDWDATYIEYGGELVNLRVLYTYRNQKPIPDLEYRTD